jgi:hypothetical protein
MICKHKKYPERIYFIPSGIASGQIRIPSVFRISSNFFSGNGVQRLLSSGLYRRPRIFTGVSVFTLAGFHRRSGISPCPEG